MYVFLNMLTGYKAGGRGRRDDIFTIHRARRKLTVVHISIRFSNVKQMANAPFSMRTCVAVCTDTFLTWLQLRGDLI